MEVVGLIASVYTLVRTAVAATRLSNNLIKTACNPLSVKKEMLAFSLELTSFASVTRIAHQSLRLNLEDEEAGSFVIKYMRDREVLMDLVGHSKAIAEHINEVRPQIRTIPSGIGLWTRIKWGAFQREEVRSLRPQMDSLKSTLALIMSILILEVKLRQSNPSEETLQEIKDLKRQIKVQVETIAILQEQIASTHGLQPIAFSNQHSAMIELVDSMVDHDTVPDFTPSLFSSRIVSSSSSIVSLDSESSRTSVERYSIPARPNPMDHPARKLHVAPDSHFFQFVQEPADVHQRSVDDYVSVRPRSYLLDLDLSDNHESVAGYINTSHGLVRATANLDPNFGDNLIAVGYAATLGLVVDPLPDDMEEEDKWVMFKDGQRVWKTGETILEWSGGYSSHRSSFSVHCWVYEHNIRNLVFGRPFVEKREHYWGH